MIYRSGNAVERWFEAVFDFIDRRYITRRIMLLGTFALVIHEVEWMMWYAQVSARTGVELSVIYAAIGTPLSALMGYMFSTYSQTSPPNFTPPASLPPTPQTGDVNVSITK